MVVSPHIAGCDMVDWVKKHEFVVCVDSDGCAMDTMDIKHEQCFGPIAAKVFNVNHVPQFIEIWNRVNLFSKTRGTNRFKGLVFSLEQYGYDRQIDALRHWVHTSDELSNRALQQQIELMPSEDLKLALSWSEEVNQSIKTLREHDAPFAHVKRSLQMIHSFADIAVVSSANNEAIIDEWTRHSLIPEVDLVYGQQEGSKASCLGLLSQYGYQSKNILMVGDSPGDLDAAKQAGTWFYPILCRREDESWDELVLKALGKLVLAEFNQTYQEELIQKFEQNLQD